MTCIVVIPYVSKCLSKISITGTFPTGSKIAGISMFNGSNSSEKDYETIIALFICLEKLLLRIGSYYTFIEKKKLKNIKSL